MTRISGQVERMNKLNDIYNARGAIVLVLQNDKPLAFGEVDDGERFEIDLPDDAAGEIEIRLGLAGAAPVIATLSGDDLELILYFNNSNYYG